MAEQYKQFSASIEIGVSTPNLITLDENTRSTFILPDGRRLRPVIVFEIQEGEGEKTTYRDIDHKELTDLGFDYDYRDTAVSFEGLINEDDGSIVPATK